MLAYLHIPFCDSKCHYCGFNSYVDKFDLKEKYSYAMAFQLSHDIEKYKLKKNSIKSLFIGGGTPSTLAPYMYKEFFEILRPFLKENAEITSEVNPNSATHEWLEGMKALGVNRLSFGVQSFFDDKLKFLGRNHSSKQAKKAILRAYDLGYENISLDLIYGTSLDTKQKLKEDIDQAFDLPINHISSYSLTLEENTPFETRNDVQKDSSSLARFFAKSIKDKGFKQYEISNYGSYTCKHNLGYWKHEEYLGIGAGAVGFINNSRYYPKTDIEEYIKKPTTYEKESLHVSDLNVEKIFLGLRCKIGVDMSILNETQLQKALLLVEEKKLLKKGNILYNPDFFLADELALFLMD